MIKLDTTNKRVLVAVLIVFSVVQPLSVFFEKLHVTVTPSVAFTFFYDSTDPITKNEYILFSVDDPRIPKDKGKLIKYASCVAGEQLTRTDDLFLCNGFAIGKAKRNTEKGEPMPYFVFDGTIPEGYLFASGYHEHSYDSRYFGLVPIDSGVIVVKPLAKTLAKMQILVFIIIFLFIYLLVKKDKPVKQLITNREAT